MKKDKKKVVKNNTISLLLSTVIILWLGIFFFYVCRGMFSVSYFGNSTKNFYTITGKCTDVYNKERVYFSKGRHTKTTEYFVIDGKTLKINHNKLSPHFSSPEEFVEFKENCKTHGVTIQYVGSEKDGGVIASIFSLKDNTIVLDLETTRKEDITNFVALVVILSLLYAGSLWIYATINWYNVKAIYIIIKKKHAKAKRKAEREKMFSKQEPQ